MVLYSIFKAVLKYSVNRIFWAKRLRNLETSNYRNAMEALFVRNMEIYQIYLKCYKYLYSILPVQNAQNVISFLSTIKIYLCNTIDRVSTFYFYYDKSNRIYKTKLINNISGYPVQGRTRKKIEGGFNPKHVSKSSE